MAQDGTDCSHCETGLGVSSVGEAGVCDASGDNKPGSAGPGKGKQTGLFTGTAFGVAAIAGVAYLLWALVTSHLPFSAFSVAGARQDDVPEYLARLSTSFFIYGLLSGFIGYHIRLSPRRPQILQGLLWSALGGGLLGAIVGAVTQLPAELAGVERARGLMAAITAARIAAIAMGIATLFTSQDRRIVLKGILVPFAAGTTLSILVLSVVPFDLGHLTRPWMLTAVIEQSSGGAAGITLVVAVVVVIARAARRRREATAQAGR